MHIYNYSVSVSLNYESTAHPSTRFISHFRLQQLENLYTTSYRSPVGCLDTIQYTYQRLMVIFLKKYSWYEAKNTTKNIVVAS